MRWIECARGAECECRYLNQQVPYNSLFALQTFQFRDGKIPSLSLSASVFSRLSNLGALNGSASGRFFSPPLHQFRPGVILLCQVGMHVSSRFTIRAINSPSLHALKFIICEERKKAEMLF